MTLVPVAGVLAVVSKVEQESPEAARQLLVHALFDSLASQVDALRPDLEPMVLTEVAKMAEEAHAALVRTSVAKAAETGELYGETEAEHLELIQEYVSKDLVGWIKAKFNRDHPRDQRGRFIRVNVQGQDPNLGRNTKQASAHNEGRAHIARLKQAGIVDDDTPIGLHYSRMAQGDDRGALGAEMGQPKVARLKDLDAMLEAAGEDEVLTGISVARGDLKLDPKKQGAMDLVGLMTGQDEMGSRRILRRLNDGQVGDQTSNAAAWNAPSAGGPQMDRKAYRRAKMTGQLLSQVAAPGSTASAVGGLAQLVGEIGPEAEKVLAPGIRRAAYRYRGTERRPSDRLVRDVKEAQAVSLGSGDWASRQIAGTPSVALGRYWHGRGTLDQRRLSTAGDAAVAHLLGLDGGPSRLPDRELAELSMASGEVPPSQGVLIDADGDVVSQAVGFNGDHYLPFDLRNLGRLYGGQYVRTRAMGGPTSEDIYTGLMTGARQVQVVSNSGVFTLEFDPDLRGGRRYNDKARRMVTRYQEMLEAINNRTDLYERDLPPAKMRELRQQAAEVSTSQADFREVLDKLVDTERMKGSLVTDDDNDEMLQAAMSAADARIAREYSGTSRNEMPSDQQKARIRESMVQEELTRMGSGAVRRLRLDGAGYDRAMRALRQEFPYFIRRAGWRPLNDWIASRGLRNDKAYGQVGANDRGYVTPGQTNPAIGLQGANARRRVPGEVRRAGEATVAPTTEAAAGTTAQTSTPAAAPAGAQAKARPVNREALTREGSPFMRELTRTLQPVALAAAEITPKGYRLANDDDPDDPNNKVAYSPLQYLNWHATKIMNTAPAGDEGKTMAKWLIGLSPDQRTKVMKGFHGLAEFLSNSDEADLAPAAEQAYLKTVEMLDMVEPYDTVEEKADPVLHRPNEEHPKPVAFPGLPGLDTDPAEIDKTIKRAATTNPVLGAAIEEFDGLSNHDRGAAVLDALDTYADQEGVSDVGRLHAQLEAMQTAWSLLHTKETAERLRKLMGGGDAGPKAPGVGFGKSGRRVIVHKLDDPFSRSTRAMLGIPEPSEQDALVT